VGQTFHKGVKQPMQKNNGQKGCLESWQEMRIQWPAYCYFGWCCCFFHYCCSHCWKMNPHSDDWCTSSYHNCPMIITHIGSNSKHHHWFKKIKAQGSTCHGPNLYQNLDQIIWITNHHWWQHQCWGSMQMALQHEMNEQTRHNAHFIMCCWIVATHQTLPQDDMTRKPQDYKLTTSQC